MKIFMEFVGRLKRWKQSWPQPRATYNFEVTEHHCLNCGKDYTGNYCPYCGQSFNTRRFTWKSMMAAILDVWSLSGRSMPSTLLQLTYRPGYLLRDYFQGRRQSYFPPIKLLLMVSLLTLTFEYFVPPRNAGKKNTKTEVSATEKDEDIREYKTLLYQYTDEVFEWGEENSGWGALMVHSFFILPTFWYFRRSRSYPKITVPECFFMQAYLCSAMLTCSCLSGYIRGFILVYFPIFYLAYRQLFGYSRWGTAWRVLLTMLTGLLMIYLFFIFCMWLTILYLAWSGQIPPDKVPSALFLE